MLNEMLAATGTATLATAGIGLSNLLRDRGVDASRSRCVAAAMGGLAFLVAVLWVTPWIAVAETGALALLIVVLRLGFRRGLRGTSGSRRGQAWAEVTFALAGTASLAIGWGLLGDRWLAFLPVAFVAWGDNAAGLARATIWRNNPGNPWPSVAMLAVCLASATLMRPFWIGAAGAVAATIAERFRPGVSRFWDDNVNVVAGAFAVIALLEAVAQGSFGG